MFVINTGTTTIFREPHCITKMESLSKTVVFNKDSENNKPLI